MFRPNPDELLATVQKEEALAKQGRLKIFLGMCPGVGKTYAMLLAAQQQQEERRNVLIGYVETHGRIETTVLTSGLARIPRQKVSYRGITLEELDLDAVLQRKPDLVLIDEFAHTNAPGGRHPKRYQDVLEILDAGIDVYTTLNVQHIESYSDVVTQITGAPIRETLPDSILDRADEIELIDITPEQLRKRLDEGRVYIGDRAATASENFFREGNLKALREIALRLSAEFADRQMREFMREQRISGPWKSRERLLVAVSPSPYSERLVRWTRRVAAAMHGSWIATYIDTGRTLSNHEKARLEKNLDLARSLGAEVITTSGNDTVEALLRIAHEQNVSQIVVGKTLGSPIFNFLKGGSLVDKLLRKSGEIDVYVVRAEATARFWRPSFQKHSPSQLLREFGIAIFVVLITTIIGTFLRSTVGYMTIGLLYLLAVLISSMFLSRWPILLTGALTAVAWNFLFIQPYYTLYISNPHDGVLFGMYFIIALVLGHLHTRLRQREQAERRHEEETIALYRFSHDLNTSHTLPEALHKAIAHIDSLFNAETSIFVCEQDESRLQLLAGPSIETQELAVATWSMQHGEPAGRSTNTLPQSERIYFPIQTANSTVGILAIKLIRNSPLGFEERQMLETFVSQIALLIEREQLQAQAELAKLEEKSRQLQKTLLDSVSHEIKTPLAIISSAVDRMEAKVESGGLTANLSVEAVKEETIPNTESARESARKRPTSNYELMDEIKTAVVRLNRIVGNLLDITRIEAGLIHPKLEWHDLQEIVDAAINRARKECDDRSIVIENPTASVAIRVDAALLEEMLTNLIRNAAQYGLAGTTICINTTATPISVQIEVIDSGPGIPPDDVPRIFEKFYRGSTNTRSGGIGMGLSIVKGFAEALGGNVTVSTRQDHKPGAVFRIVLPSETKATEAIQ